MEIKILDPVYSQIVEKQYIPMVSNLLSFQAEYWRRQSIKDKNGVPTGKSRMVRQTYPKSMVMPSGMFFTGHVPKVVEYLKGKGILVSTVYDSLMLKPQIHEIHTKLRPYQASLLENALQPPFRGVIKAPTGSGKTFLAACIITSFKDIRALFLCHTITLVHQTVKEFQKLGLSVGFLTGSDNNLTGDILVSTVQSFCKQGQELFDCFDMVIVDEMHHLASGPTAKKEGGYYYRVLTKMIAPLRYGLTATLPTKEETKLLVEGLIGPLIGEYSLKEGMEGGFLAVPKLKFIKIPVDHKVHELRKYQDVYDQGIVNNKSRNRMVIKTAKDLAAEGKTSLILITKIEHGNNLVEIADLLGFKVVFIQGKDDGEMREMVRESLNNKEIKCVVGTVVFKEGIDLPSLNCLINAAGGKSEIALLQSVGRGLRATKDKDTVLIVDFLDLSHHYLTSHLAERLAVYSSMDWL